MGHHLYNTSYAKAIVENTTTMAPEPTNAPTVAPKKHRGQRPKDTKASGSQDAVADDSNPVLTENKNLVDHHRIEEPKKTSTTLGELLNNL